METELKHLAWRRFCFLLSPEDSSAAQGGLPEGVTPRCCRAKAVLWMVVSVGMAILLGQL
ncbi:hypothetical protein DSCO28_42000 [Desulfosarcina ovata subsp. sediminis]|uniref:Uncharacterized protein n=1 Tax=Desulfosarcina ovata subsp. sediminis TaxID=885957 RepID=A0A5K7ZTX9_9BACT|nr:hypothetical protein [Desulfosarcina ovata]BBO83634.1 hypothetical protein DSCO28_42000 [Desulfosarcina ovata subsp. sediminis]